MPAAGTVLARLTSLRIFKPMLDINRFHLPFRENKLVSLAALVVLVVPLAFSFYTYENFETVKYSLWLILTGWMLLVFIFSTRREDGKYLLKYNRPVISLLAAFLFFGFLSTLFSVDKLNSLFGFYYRFTNGLLFYAIWALLIFLLVQVLDKDKYIYLLKVLVFDAAVVAVFGLAQSMGFAIYGEASRSGFVSAPGFLGNPNFSAMFMVGVLPFALLFFYQAKSFAGKIYFSLAALFMVLASLVMASRGAAVALVASLAFGLLMLGVYKLTFKQMLKPLLGVLLAVVLVGTVLKVTRPDAFRTVRHLSDQNIALRLLVWDTTARNLVHNPWLGIGPGNFHIFFEQNRGRELSGQVGVFDDAHNLYLHMAATTGIPFALSFILLLLLAFIYGLRQLKSGESFLALAGLVSLVAFAIAASFTPVSVGCFLLIALVVAGQFFPFVRERTWGFSGRWGPLLAVLPAGLLIVGLGLLVSEHIFAYAYRSYFSGNYTTAYRYSNLAIKFNPTNYIYYTYRTGSAINMGQTEQLVTHQIKELESLKSSQARTYSVAANLYYLLYKQKKDPKYLEQAAASLGQSIKLDPLFSERYGLLGLYNYQLGRPEEAKKNLRKALSLNDDLLPSWILLAKIYQLEGKRPQTLFALERAFRVRPDLPQVQMLLQLAKNEPDIRRVPIQVLVGEGKLE